MCSRLPDNIAFFLSHLTLICCRRVLTFALVSQKIQPAFKSEPLSAKTPQLLRKFLQKSSNLALYNRSEHATGCQAKPEQLYPRITLIKALVSCRFPTPRLYGKQNQGVGTWEWIRLGLPSSTEYNVGLRVSQPICVPSHSHSRFAPISLSDFCGDL